MEETKYSPDLRTISIFLDLLIGHYDILLVYHGNVVMMILSEQLS